MEVTVVWSRFVSFGLPSAHIEVIEGRTVVVAGYPAQAQKVLTIPLAWDRRLDHLDALASCEVVVILVVVKVVFPVVEVDLLVVARLTLADGVTVTVLVTVPG